ncbi:MAG: hypothetical protein LUG64_02675, partial [Clostridiales bacterium]|nr:hypothetical protein [Clostridiales bacterium]
AAGRDGAWLAAPAPAAGKPRERAIHTNLFPLCPSEYGSKPHREKHTVTQFTYFAFVISGSTGFAPSNVVFTAPHHSPCIVQTLSVCVALGFLFHTIIERSFFISYG